MKTILLILLGVVIALGALFIYNKSEAKTDEQAIYYYYPTANVYYNATAKEYIIEDGDTWITNKNVAADVENKLGKRVLIEEPSTPVWNDNEHHRFVYAASLYMTPGDFAQKYREDSLKSLPPKKPKKVVPEEEEKEKKGIEKFFDDIFGGEEKKKEKEKKKSEKI
jgi:hypothetical protein